MKKILVIGMGRFGSNLAERLLKLGNDVLIVDSKEELIQEYSDIFTNTMIADCTDPEALKAMDIPSFDVAFVCIANNFEASLVITALLKELGALCVVSKATKTIQVELLYRVGADEVIDPDSYLAEKYASKYNASNVFDFIELPGSDYDIYEVEINPKWIKQTIFDINIRAKYGVNIIGIRNGKHLQVNLPSDYVFKENDHIVVIANEKTIEKFATHKQLGRKKEK